MNANRFVRLRPPRIAMGLVLIALLVHARYPVSVSPQFPLLATTVATAGFLIMIRAWWLFRKVETPICPTDVPLTMVTEDVFSFSRNPMYLGMILMLVALALNFGTLPFIAAAAAYAVVMDRIFCPYEERAMLQRFGASYEAYRRRVRRWL
jgi:protein-S-isoprenylcysteine O-methyltransferase Ste14